MAKQSYTVISTYRLPYGKTNIIGGMTRQEAVELIIKYETQGYSCTLSRNNGNTEYTSPWSK